MKVTLSHSGKQHSYHVAKSLLDLGSLDKFYTSSYIKYKPLQQYLLNSGNTYWTRRFLDGVSGKYVDANWRFELKEIVSRKLYGKNHITQNAVYARDVNFDEYVAKQLPKRLSEVFWGFQGSCFESLKAANASGKISVCELATAHVTEAKKILGEEAKLHPEWADSIDNLVFPSAYEKRLEEEPQIANYAVAASEFTRQTLLSAGISSNKIIKLPLGFDMNYVPYVERKEDNIEDRPLRLLYAGTVTQRKGIKYILEAMKTLQADAIELHIIGGIQGSGQALKAYEGLYKYHPPVSQLEMFKLYSAYDALVLPTVFEGFGLVIVEAMAAGLPVITTPHSIGPDLIQDGKNGYIVPVRDINSLQKAVSDLRGKSASDYIQMRSAARNSAENYTWDLFRNNLHSILHILHR